MSPVVAVRAVVAAQPAALEHPSLPRRVVLDLAELVACARLAGDVPLPLTLDPEVSRLSERLSGGEFAVATAALEAALARADDDGPDGAVAALAARGLVREGEVDAGLAQALRVVAGGAGLVQVDLSHLRPSGAVSLRSWLGLKGRLVAQLSTSGGADFEVAWFDLALWHSQVTRAITLEEPSVDSVRIPDWVSLPTELLVGARKAMSEQRPDLVAGLVEAHAGEVLVADTSTAHVRPVALPVDRAIGLVTTLVSGSVGRLRALTRRRGPEGGGSVLSWVLFDDDWHELSSGPGVAAVFRRRRTDELSILLEPFAVDVARRAHDE